jgi:hypothetical protein
MNSANNRWPEADRDGLPTVPGGSALSHRRWRIRLNPVVSVAAAGLALGFGLESDRFGFGLRKPPTVSLGEAVDISLQRLMRHHVADRFQRTHRLDASLQRNRDMIDAELGRVREHPLYVRVKEKMTDYLRYEGYERVPITATADPKEPMLSSEAESTLNAFLHSLRASFPAPNEKVAEFLRDQEAVFGKSTANFQGANRYDTAFTFLIRLLFEYPDDLKPVAGAVRFLTRSQEDIERSLRGKGPSPQVSLEVDIP